MKQRGGDGRGERDGGDGGDVEEEGRGEGGARF
jgi:hypothetical protein